MLTHQIKHLFIIVLSIDLLAKELFSISVLFVLSFNTDLITND